MLQRKSLAPILALVSGLTLNACNMALQGTPKIKLKSVDVGQVRDTSTELRKGSATHPMLMVHFKGEYKRGGLEESYFMPTDPVYDRELEIDCGGLVEAEDFSMYARDGSDVFAAAVFVDTGYEVVKEKDGYIDVPGILNAINYGEGLCKDFMAKVAEVPKIEAPKITKSAPIVKSAKPSKASKVRKSSRPRRSSRAARAPRPSGRD